MKKLAAAALAAAMVLSLAGCGSSTKKIESKADLKDAVRKKAAGEPGENPGQCSLLYWSSGIS